MTLIEVLVSLLILSVLLGSVLIARARMSRLKANANAKLGMVRATDKLITNWWIQYQTIPKNASGTFGSTPIYRWETRRVPTLTNNGLKLDTLEVVRVTVESNDTSNSSASVSVDLLISKQRDVPTFTEQAVR